jgi:hypothetical protein
LFVIFSLFFLLSFYPQKGLVTMIPTLPQFLGLKPMLPEASASSYPHNPPSKLLSPQQPKQINTNHKQLSKRENLNNGNLRGQSKKFPDFKYKPFTSSNLNQNESDLDDITNNAAQPAGQGIKPTPAPPRVKKKKQSPPPPPAYD